MSDGDNSYQVDVIGFNETERLMLSSIFGLAARRDPSFVQRAPGRRSAFGPLPGGRRQRGGDGRSSSPSAQRFPAPAVLIGASDRNTGLPLLSRPAAVGARAAVLRRRGAGRRGAGAVDGKRKDHAAAGRTVIGAGTKTPAARPGRPRRAAPRRRSGRAPPRTRCSWWTTTPPCANSWKRGSRPTASTSISPRPASRRWALPAPRNTPACSSTWCCPASTATRSAS